MSEKWALAYERLAFCAYMKSTQLSEKMNSALRNHPNHEPDLAQFFLHFERLLEEYRCAELKSSYWMSHGKGRLLIVVKMLKQAADVYTPAIFGMIKAVYVLRLEYVVNLFSEAGPVTDYRIPVDGKPREYIVSFNSSDTIVCSCRKFEFVGILRSHALKVLDHSNVRVVSPRYISKRWSKDAEFEIVKYGRTCEIQDDPKFDLLRRYKELCRNIAETEEAFAAFFINKLFQGVEGILRRTYSNIAKFVKVNMRKTYILKVWIFFF